MYVHVRPAYEFRRTFINPPRACAKVLFLLIMDPLLKSLQSKGLGPSVGGTYAGAFIHAGDIRTITQRNRVTKSALLGFRTRATLPEQIDTVCKFAVDSGLSLNPTQCEVVLVSPSKPEESAPITILGGKALTPHLNAKCLGYWWSWDLSASKAVDEAIKKARRAFFAFGAMGAFQGQLNPVSTRSIYETCVVPVLLLTDSMLHQLESFQGEIGRRMLKLSKYHSTLSTRLALKWPSITARIFIRKLSLLSKVCQEGNNIGNKIFSSFNQDSLRLTQECRAMEGKLSCHGFTDALLSVRSTLKEIKRHVLQIDWEACITDASHHSSTAVASRIASETSWMKLWDIALDYGPRGSSSLQALYRELTRPQLQPGVCHLCGTTLDTPFFHHYTLYHTPPSDPERIINSLLSASSDILCMPNIINCPYFIYQCHAIVWLAVHKTLNMGLQTKRRCTQDRRGGSLWGEGMVELFCIQCVVLLGPAGRRNVRCCVLSDYACLLARSVLRTSVAGSSTYGGQTASKPIIRNIGRFFGQPDRAIYTNNTLGRE